MAFSFLLTSGNALYRLMSAIDMFKYFAVIEIILAGMFLFLSITVMSNLSLLNYIPNFMKDSFFKEMALEGIQEKGMEHLNNIKNEKFQKVKEVSENALAKMSFEKSLLNLAIYLSGFISLVYFSWNYYDENMPLDATGYSLLAFNIIIVAYYFYKKVKFSK